MLGYFGRWGERRRGIYDGVTGPNTKQQWTKPLTWADESWRSQSFALAGGRSLGPQATKFFCGAVGAVSTGLIAIAARPAASLATVAIVVLAQAVALDGESARGSLRRSARLVRGHWWRTASLTVFVTGLALLLGPVVGINVVNLASDLVYTVSLPFAAIATTYLYFDLASRQESPGRTPQERLSAQSASASASIRSSRS